LFLSALQSLRRFLAPLRQLGVAACPFSAGELGPLSPVRIAHDALRPPLALSAKSQIIMLEIRGTLSLSPELLPLPVEVEVKFWTGL
jgi:hypothetical protein